MNGRLAATQLVLLVGLVACSSAPNVIQTDLTRQKGVYLVGYSLDASARRDFENELQTNLMAGGMLAHASHADIPDITDSDATEVLQYAVERGVVAIVIINNAQDSAVEDVRRLQIDTPGVREHFDKISRQRAVVSGNDVVLEVNAFAIDGDTAKLAWSGVTAVFAPTSRTDAIEDLSESIAGALRSAQKRVRSGT